MKLSRFRVSEVSRFYRVSEHNQKGENVFSFERSVFEIAKIQHVDLEMWISESIKLFRKQQLIPEVFK